MRRPIEQSYWVVPGKLLAGEYPRDLDEESSIQKLNSLIQAGITAFIDLTEEHELAPYSGMIDGASYQRFPVRDISIPNSPETTTSILDSIDQQVNQGKVVYVHCWGGVGRTGLIIGCWLARRGLCGMDAFNRLQELWKECPKSAYRNSPETGEQKRYIINWSER